MNIPSIHVIENNGQSIGICTERPILIRISEVTKAILRVRSNSDPDDKVDLNSLHGHYLQSDFQSALDELMRLGEKIDQFPAVVETRTNYPHVLSVEILSNSPQEFEVIKKAITFLMNDITAKDAATMILDLRCSPSRHFCKNVWKYGRACAKMHSGDIKFVLKMPLSSLTREVIEEIKNIPTGMQFVVGVGDSIPALDTSVNMNLTGCLLKAYPVCTVEKENITSIRNNLGTLAQYGMSIIHQPAGICAYSLASKEWNVCATDRKESPAYYAASELLKYFSVLTTSMPVEFHCGAGRWYWAISATGNIYPCHRFINDDRFLVGNINDVVSDKKAILVHHLIPVSKKEDCHQCWAKHLCGGGCAYHAVRQGEPLGGIDASLCDNIRHNVEQAAVLYAGMDDVTKIVTGKLTDTMKTTIPYWQANPPFHEDGSFSLLSSGNSMQPLIQDGATLTLVYVHPKHLRIGDVFSYKRGDKIITHRVMGKFIKRGKYFIIEKGDNAFFAETTAAELIGRVILLKNPGMKRAIPIDTPLWRVTNYFIVVLVMILWLTYFICRTGGVFVVQLIKQHFSLSQALTGTVQKTSLLAKSHWFLTLTNRMTQYSTSLLLSIHHKGNTNGTS